MAGHLKRELAVARFVEQLAGSGFLDRQSAEHERARRESEILIRLLTFQAHTGNGLRAPKSLFKDDQIPGKTAENRTGGLNAVVLARSRSGRERL